MIRKFALIALIAASFLTQWACNSTSDQSDISGMFIDLALKAEAHIRSGQYETSVGKAWKVVPDGAII